VEEQGLSNGLGGVNAIAVVVDRYCDAIVETRSSIKNPALTEWNEFDEVGAEIASALDHFNVPEREKQEILAAILARKVEVVSSPRR
jgi:hypothetical protein